MPQLDSFDKLFKEYSAPMQQIAYGVVRSREMAAEIVQDVFLKLWSARESIAVETDIRSYLARATRNRALDLAAREALHRKWQERRHESDDLPHGSNSSHDADARDADDLQLALSRAVSDALAEMPARRREVCELRWIADVGPTAIAQRMGIAVKTVETQIARGKIQLREKIAQVEQAQ